jgi:hypothetical protein
LPVPMTAARSVRVVGTAEAAAGVWTSEGIASARRVLQPPTAAGGPDFRGSTRFV